MEVSLSMQAAHGLMDTNLHPTTLGTSRTEKVVKRVNSLENVANIQELILFLTVTFRRWQSCWSV